MLSPPGYSITAHLATGGMGEIYVATRAGAAGFSKTVALKVLSSDFATDPTFVNMFIDEARILSRLRHPNIVQVFDFISYKNTLYMALEYVRGVSLTGLSSLSQPEAAAVSDAVFAALAYAHQQGVVHRDIAPANVLISVDGEIKLGDFGIARAADRLTRTRTGVLKGRVRYMAPEVAAGRTADARSDVFSAALLSFELFSGKRLRPDLDDVALIDLVRSGQMPPLDRVWPGGGPLLAFFDKALSPERFADGAALRAAFRSAYSGPLAAPSVTAPNLVERDAERSRGGRAKWALLFVIPLAALPFLTRTPSPAPPVAVPTPPPVPPPARQEPEAPTQYGYISVNALPWAWVYIDGKKIEQPTPIVKHRLTSGPHELRVVGPSPGQRQTLRIEVEPNRATTHLIRFN